MGLIMIQQLLYWQITAQKDKSQVHMSSYTFVSRPDPNNTDIYIRAVHISYGLPIREQILNGLHMQLYMPCIACPQELCKGSGSSSDQNVSQQSSEIMMLKTKFETINKQHQQLIDVHSKCKNRKENSRSIAVQTDDQVHCIHTHS